jgi:nicotinamide/nicotinate riboside kinase
MVIGIGGVSNAGKTTLANRLKDALRPLHVKILCQDDFARPVFEIPRIRDHVDWEVPESIDLARYYRHILKAREENDIVIAEGLFAFCDKHIYSHYDKKIFLTISKETFLRRKSKDLRWGKEPEWYMEHIWQSHFKCGMLKEFDENTIVLSGEETIDLNKLLPLLEIQKFVHRRVPSPDLSAGK